VNAVISFVFPSTTDWPSTIPLLVSSAASRCTARSSARRAPRADLPSTAITLGDGILGEGTLGGGAAIRARPDPALSSGALGCDALGCDALGCDGSGVGGLVRAARAISQSDTTRSSASGSTFCRIRRIADSLGVARPTVSPSRTRTPSGRSWAHSAIAT
jgi:hypothetical protein